jgi:glutamate---cysteine ligase / carboxylate-amine ligase
MAHAADFTLGVEEEYQLVDQSTGALRSHARYVLAGDWADELRREMQEHTVEVGTGVCERTGCVREDLARLRFTAAVAAEAAGLRILAAGTHPFSTAEGHRFTPEPVYLALRDTYRRLAESQAIFGMHVHVGLPPGVDRARVSNVLRLHLPLLLGLSASSPYFQGQETGHASYRSVLWSRWPRTGAPPRFADDAAFAAAVEWLVAAGRIDGPGRLYWDLRPHHRYPTVEVRVPDCTPRLDDAVAIAALTRAVAAAAAEGILEDSPLSDPLLDTVLSDNRWRAARFGADAVLGDVERREPGTIALRDAVLRLVERVAPIADALGDAEEISGIPALLERGPAADEIRRRISGGATLGEVTLWMAAETALGTGMDRRSRQREQEPV